MSTLAEQVKTVTAERDTTTGILYQEKIGGAFGRSKFVADKIAVPPDMLQNTFGKAFKVEDGKVVAYGDDGNKIYSRVRPGELADFDEALEALVERYPHRENILKGSGASGGGAPNNGGRVAEPKHCPALHSMRLIRPLRLPTHEGRHGH